MGRIAVWHPGRGVGWRGIFAAALLLLIQPAVALDTDPPVVDGSPALSIGDFEVSRYLLDKNYNQFIAEHREKSGSPPTRDEIADWFRLFVARQAIHARLADEGYLGRPEVRREVDRMVRQILTQADGPLYSSLIPAEALTPERLRSLHETSARVFDVLLVRVDDAATAGVLLGSTASPGDFEKAARALARSGKTSAFDLSDGPSTWPYGAFQEIADIIPEAPQGTVVGPIPRVLGVYFLLVRSESRRPLPDFEATRESWARYIRRMSQNLVQSVRRRQILQECGFRPEAPAIAQFAERVRPVKDGPHTIDEKAAFAGVERTLATYAASGGRRPITDRDFVRHFNQRIIRSLPRDPVALVSAIEDIVIEEADYAAAVAARLDQEAKFVQDRRNFELRQALALYENEVLVPKIEPTPVELQYYYAERNGRYAVTSEATGVLYVFPSGTAAAEALPRLDRGDTAGVVACAEQVIDPILVRRDGPALASDRPNTLFLAMPDGRALGPFEHKGRPAVFVKRSAGARKAPPLAEIQNLVRQDFLREKLDEAELALFWQRNDRRSLHVYFEFSRYGIQDPFGDEGGAFAVGTTREPPCADPPRALR